MTVSKAWSDAGFPRLYFANPEKVFQALLYAIKERWVFAELEIFGDFNPSFELPKFSLFKKTFNILPIYSHLDIYEHIDELLNMLLSYLRDTRFFVPSLDTYTQNTTRESCYIDYLGEEKIPPPSCGRFDEVKWSRDWALQRFRLLSKIRYLFDSAGIGAGKKWETVYPEQELRSFARSLELYNSAAATDYPFNNGDFVYFRYNSNTGVMYGEDHTLIFTNFSQSIQERPDLPGRFSLEKLDGGFEVIKEAALSDLVGTYALGGERPQPISTEDHFYGRRACVHVDCNPLFSYSAD